MNLSTSPPDEEWDGTWFPLLVMMIVGFVLLVCVHVAALIYDSL